MKKMGGSSRAIFQSVALDPCASESRGGSLGPCTGNTDS